jgi:hypothetical protein
MSFLEDNAHDAVFSAETLRLGAILWYLLKAIQTLEVQKTQSKELNDKVGRDEIHWWIVERENDLDQFRARTERALVAADALKQASTTLKDKLRPDSYDHLLTSLREFADAHAKEIQQLHEYAKWLHERDVLAPSILFSYRVWGSTRRGDRWIDVAADSPAAEDQQIMHTLTEIALGLRTDKVSAFDRAVFDVGSDTCTNVIRTEPVIAEFRSTRS